MTRSAYEKTRYQMMKTASHLAVSDGCEALSYDRTSYMKTSLQFFRQQLEEELALVDRALAQLEREECEPDTWCEITAQMNGRLELEFPRFRGRLGTSSF